MRAALFAGLRFAARHRWITLITALAVAVPLLITALGVIADQSSRPSPQLQKVAVAGHGKSRITEDTIAIGTGNDDLTALKELDRIAPGVFRKVDSVSGVPAVAHGVGYIVALDQRDWSDPLFDNMLEAVAGRLPAGRNEVAVTPVAAADLHLTVGDRLTVANADLTVVGIYQRPYALRAELVFVPRDTVVQLSVDQFQAVFTVYIGDREMSVAELDALDPALWNYLDEDEFVTKVSYLSKAPIGYGLVLLIALVGLMIGAWSLTARRRRLATQTMIRLGAGRPMLVGAALIEAMCGAVVGAAIAAAVLSITGPIVHRRTAAAAGIVAEPGWFPWSATILIAGAGVAMVGMAAGVMAVLFSRQGGRANIPAEGGRSLEARVRRTARSRSLFLLFGVLSCVTITSATSVIWMTGNESQRVSDPGTRRPGDIEVVLGKHSWIPDLADGLTAQFGGQASRIRQLQPATWQGGADGSDVLVLTSPTAPQTATAPVQLIATRADWTFLTGREPTDAEWDNLAAGKMAVFSPELQLMPEIDLSVANTTATTTTVLTSNIPHFPVSVDAVTLNRAKGAVGSAFLAAHKLIAVDTSLIVHTDSGDQQATEAAAGRIVLQHGLTGADIRFGRPFSPDPPLMVILLTVGPALLAMELAIFSILATATDERRTRRLLTALGAGFGRRFNFVFGVAGLLTAVAAVLGLAIGCIFGGTLTASWNGWGMVRLPLTELLGLSVGLIVIAVVTCGLVAVRTAEGRAGRS